MEDWKRGWLEEEAQSRMNVLRQYQDGWGREKGRLEEGMDGRLEEGMVGRMEVCMGWRKKHNQG